MKFFNLFIEQSINLNSQLELNQKLLSNFEDNNYNNCWCCINYNNEDIVVRLVGYKDGYYSFFDYDTNSYTFLPLFLLLKEEEFSIKWIGKGKEEEEDEEFTFGVDKEKEFKIIMNYRYDYGYSFEPMHDSDSESDSNSKNESGSESGSESESESESGRSGNESESDNISVYDCSDGELDMEKYFN